MVCVSLSLSEKTRQAPNCWSGWWFQISFIFTQIPGEMIQFDSYFSDGWFNHQPLVLPRKKWTFCFMGSNGSVESALWNPEVISGMRWESPVRVGTKNDEDAMMGVVFSSKMPEGIEIYRWFALSILTPQKCLFWEPGPLLYRFQPLHWRVPGSLGWMKFLFEGWFRKFKWPKGIFVWKGSFEFQK